MNVSNVKNFQYQKKREQTKSLLLPLLKERNTENADIYATDYYFVDINVNNIVMKGARVHHVKISVQSHVNMHRAIKIA